MTLDLDLTVFAAAARRKTQTYDNCEVLDLDPESVGSTVYPRMIEVRPAGDDGPRVFARWDGSLNLAVNDIVMCEESGNNPVWIVKSMGGDSSGAGVARVSDVWESDFGAVALAADASGNLLGSAALSADSFSFIAKNTSGATATANDVGYIDEAGEYKTTTTATDKVAWCVVIVGGANNADIHVARRGRVTAAYAGSAPSAGDYLVTSTTAGSAQGQTTISPEIFAVCLAGGSGGDVSALLLTERVKRSLAFTNDILLINGANDSDFVSTVAAAGVSGDKVYYSTITSGSLDAITPNSSSELAKIILHNTTQSLEARIIAVGTDGTGNFIQVNNSADISAWVSTDAITTRSQTNTSAIGASYFFDLEFTDEATSAVPALTDIINMAVQYRDSGSTGQFCITHPFETGTASKRQVMRNALTTQLQFAMSALPLIDRRFTLSWQASGAGTAFATIRLLEIGIITP